MLISVFPRLTADSCQLHLSPVCSLALPSLQLGGTSLSGNKRRKCQEVNVQNKDNPHPGRNVWPLELGEYGMFTWTVSTCGGHRASARERGPGSGAARQNTPKEGVSGGKVEEISHSSTWHNYQHSTFNQLKTHLV